MGLHSPVVFLVELVQGLQTQVQVLTPAEVQTVRVDQAPLLGRQFGAQGLREGILEGTEGDAGLHLDLFDDAFSDVGLEVRGVQLETEGDRGDDGDAVGLIVDLSHSLDLSEGHEVSVLEEMLLVVMHCHHCPLLVLGDG